MIEVDALRRDEGVEVLSRLGCGWPTVSRSMGSQALTNVPWETVNSIPGRAKGSSPCLRQNSNTDMEQVFEKRKVEK
jgi:hypothetical protein